MVFWKILLISFRSKVIKGFQFGWKFNFESKSGFFWFWPQNIIVCQRDPPKRHIIAQSQVVWAIMRVDPTVCSARTWIEETKRKLTNQAKRYISRMRGNTTMQAILMNFGTSRDLADFISSSNVCVDQFSCFWVSRVQNWEFPIVSAFVPYHVAIRYRDGMWKKN